MQSLRKHAIPNSKGLVWLEGILQKLIGNSGYVCGFFTLGYGNTAQVFRYTTCECLVTNKKPNKIPQLFISHKPFPGATLTSAGLCANLQKYELLLLLQKFTWVCHIAQNIGKNIYGTIHINNVTYYVATRDVYYNCTENEFPLGKPSVYEKLVITPYTFTNNSLVDHNRVVACSDATIGRMTIRQWWSYENYNQVFVGYKSILSGYTHILRSCDCCKTIGAKDTTVVYRPIEHTHNFGMLCKGCHIVTSGSHNGHNLNMLCKYCYIGMGGYLFAKVGMLLFFIRQMTEQGYIPYDISFIIRGHLCDLQV